MDLYKLLDYGNIIIYLTKKWGSKAGYLILEVRQDFSQIGRKKEKISEEM